MLATIWSNPDLAEVLFLFAVILFAVELALKLAKRPVADGVLTTAGLLCVALAWLAF